MSHLSPIQGAGGLTQTGSSTPTGLLTFGLDGSLSWAHPIHHCRLFNSIAGLYPLDASSTVSSCDNQNCPQIFPNVPGGQDRSHTSSLELLSENGRRGGPTPGGWASFSHPDREKLRCLEEPLAHHALWPPGHLEERPICPPAHLSSLTAQGRRWGT